VAVRYSPAFSDDPLLEIRQPGQHDRHVGEVVPITSGVSLHSPSELVYRSRVLKTGLVDDGGSPKHSHGFLGIVVAKRERTKTILQPSRGKPAQTTRKDGNLVSIRPWSGQLSHLHHLCPAHDYLPIILLISSAPFQDTSLTLATAALYT
jgi:hypothetical protein